MGATSLAANNLATSAAKTFHTVLLLSALVVTASLSSWAQTITVAPARVVFSKTIVGVTSSSKAVTLTNKGASAQAVNFVTSGDFSETDNCGGSVASGHSCKVNISFTPTLVGTVSGAAGIYDSGNNLLAFVGITGAGIAPVTTAPTSLSFISGTIGTQSAAQTFQITNNTSSTVNITGITTNVTDYQISTGTCLTTPLAKAGSCTVSVQVTPTSAADNGAIIITDDAPNAVPQVVKLTSKATAGTSPITLSKTMLTFTTLSGGTSAPQTVTVTNTSAAVVALGTITASTDYTISSTTCTSSLAAKGKCTFSVEFQPTFAGIIGGAAAVPFTTSNSNSPLVVNLTGTSVPPLTFAPAKLTFLSQAIGTTSAAQSVQITNHSASAVTLNSVLPTADFQIQPSGTTCSLTGGSLAASSACTIEMQFAPTVVGPIVGALTVTNNASPNPLLIPLAGTGGTGAAGFTLSAAPSSLSIAQGTNGTSTITVNPANGFTGSVSLAVTSTLPSGVTASFNPTSTTTTSILTLTASGTAATGGPTTVTVTGTSGSLTQTTTISLTVTTAANFTLSAAPSSLSIAQGTNGTSTITVNPANGFTGSVSLAVTSTLPSGVTASFNPTSTTSTSILTLTASGTAATGGPTTVTVTGTSGSLTQTATISLTVTTAPNFTLSAAPSSLSIAQGTNGTSTITVNPANGFTGSVSLAVTSTLPSGVTASFNPTSTTTTSILTLTASGTAATGGPTTVTVTGTSGSLTQTTTISLTVTTAPNFTLSAAPSSLSIAQGTNGTSTITVNPTNGFTGSVSLAVTSTLPSGVTASFNPTSTTSTSILTLTASGTAATGGPTTVTVTGTSGSLTRTATISLTVTAAGPGAVLNPASAHQGSSETIVITGTGTNFGLGTTVNFGADITTGPLSVNGPTIVSVPVTIDNVAATGPRSVTITTGSKVVNATFTVIAGVPGVTLINPNTIAPTQTESVSVTGVFTNWASGTTKASFGPGISVGGAPAGAFGPVTVSGATSLTANLKSSGASNGYRTVQIQTGSQILTVNNGMFVGTCTSTAPAVLQVSPADGVTNAPVNTQIQIQFSVPMNRSSFTLKNTGTVFFYDANNPAQEIPGTISLDASGTIATITPTGALAAGDQFYTYLSNNKPYVQDTCANVLPFLQYSFNSAFNVDTAGPTLTGTSPMNGDTGIPLSGNSGATPVVLRFDTPIDPITAQTGFWMQSSGGVVPGNFTYSTDDQTVTFTPVTPLTASTSYTVNYSAQITDAAGNSLTNPGSYAFTTGTTSDTTTPSVVLVDPPNGTFGVGLNIKPHLTFSEPVDGLNLLTALNLVYADSGVIIPATVTVSANRFMATLTPSAPLLPNTSYNLSLSPNSYTDIAGNFGSGASTSFYTGASADTNPATVATISPTNAQTGVPLNTQVVALMNENIDPTTVTNSSITVTPKNGSPIAGTVKLASDGVTLTFASSAALSASTIYNVSVGGFKDIEGNTVTTFASSFTTGTTSYGSGSFTVVSTSPADGATNAPVTSPVTFTMSNLINAASVNSSTVYISVTSTGQVVAGSYGVSGAAVTFTPLTQYPASTLMNMTVCNLTDAAGNGDCQGYSFTTANTADKTPPTVTISPANGATNVGLNTQVVLSFSESINPSTITPNTVALFNGDTALNYGYSISRDNRTIVMNPGGNAFAPGATITVELGAGIRDLSGNTLANTSSQFVVTTALPNTQPLVAAMRPGDGATDVPGTTLVTLFTSAAMNPATIAGALHVTDNGAVVSGMVQLFSNGQAIEFTPDNSFFPGDSIQVYLDSTALSADGIPLQSFSGQFTVSGSPAKTMASVDLTNPFADASSVPLNTVIQIEYDQALQASTITSTTVALYQYSTGTFLTPTLSLVGNGQVINIAPTSSLVAGSQYSVYINNGGAVTNTKGLPVEAYTLNFTAGAAADNVAPTIVSQAPTSNSTNIGTNALVSVNFSKPINPVSVTGSTIQLSAGTTTEVPSSISFSPDYTRVSITPMAPLPASTQMTVTLNGVTSVAGKSVVKTTKNFTTAAQPDFIPPYVVNPSVQDGQTNVPVNSVFTMQYSKLVDVGSLNVATVGVFSGGCADGPVPATVTWSADQTTISILPTAPLAVGAQYYLYSDSITDLAGNPQQTFCNGFTTSFSANTNPPAVVNTSPENTQTQVPVNAPVQILFSEPINPTSIGQITITTGATAVSLTPTFTAANQLLTLTPALPLLFNTNYTLTITGVKDTAGNQMTATVTTTFTTGPMFNVLHPSVTLTDPPAGATGVGTNVAPRILFNERLNPLSVVSSAAELYYNGSIELYNYATGQWVPATVTMSADRLTATITPKSPLQPNSNYVIYAGTNAPYYDVAGNSGIAYFGNFWTGLGSDTTHNSVSTVSPVNAQTGVPLNAQVVAVMNDGIDPTTVTNSSIMVTPSGGSAVSGTVALASDGVTLTFVPTAALAPSTVYNVSVGGFSDVEGNSVTTFTSSFTTGTASYGSGTFTIASTSPVNGATSVPVTSPVTFTMTNLVNMASVNSNSVEVRVFATQAVIAGTYSVSGAAVTFTPLAQYPANTQMGMYVNGIMDEAGNNVATGGWTFTTAVTVDHTAPTVAITPANGTTNAGLNTQVVLTFSESINPATITPGSVNLLNGDVPLNPATSISRDNRAVVLNYNGATLPAGATVTVTATNLIADLSGNALANTTSQFTTAPAVSNAAPYVISMRPGNGATNVPGNTVITLFASTLMNASSLIGALHISQDGVLVPGTTSVGSNGQSVEFTPASALGAGASIQVVLDSTAQDVYGNFLQYFSGSFTTAGPLTNTPAQVQALNPFPGATNVPLNTVIQVEYNQALKASTINDTNVVLYEYSSGTFLTPTLSLSGNGQLISIAPTGNLVAGSQYFARVGLVTNVEGVPVHPYELDFTAGPASDTVAPTILTVAPPNASTNIGTNAVVSVDFNKPVNPVSVTGSSIQLTGGSATEVPSSISFSTDYTRTMIIPQAPLPSSTQMAMAISGVTGVAGASVASQTTHFTTMAGADFIAPYVVNSSVLSGQTVGTNAAFALQFNKPIDLGSIDGAAAGLSSFFCGVGPQFQVPATVSWSADQTTIFFAPTSALNASTTYYLYSDSLTDLAGNPQQNFCVSFFSGTGNDTAGPVVQQVSPPSGFTNVPINAPVQILFSEPLSAATVGGVTLKQGSTVIPATTSLYDGNRGIQLLPKVPLAPSTVYTINVTGVVDITGNTQSSFPSQSFTTGTGTNLVAPAVASTNPTNGANNVADNTTVQVVFNEAMDPASFDPNNSFALKDASNNIVPATITFSVDYKTATLHPAASLTSGVTYTMYVGWNGSPSLQDLGGNSGTSTNFSFTTH